MGLRDAMRTLGRKADTVIRIDIRTTWIQTRDDVHQSKIIAPCIIIIIIIVIIIITICSLELVDESTRFVRDT